MTQPPGEQPPFSYGPPPPGHFAPEHPQATLSLILGVLGIVVCGVAAPFAWQIGRRTVAEIDASQGRLGGRGAAQAGYVLGIVGTVLLGFAVLMVVGLLAAFVVLGVGVGFSS
jgi:TRAP-type C4-dicarboxylate transport system permease small subunit